MSMKTSLINNILTVHFIIICKVHDGVKLKISTNSTRRVRWYARLGFYKNPTSPIPINLESVLPRGGLIGSLSLVILRKYSMIYLERKTNAKSSMYCVSVLKYLLFIND